MARIIFYTVNLKRRKFQSSLHRLLTAVVLCEPVPSGMLLPSDFARSILNTVDREVQDVCLHPVEHPIAISSELNPKSYIRCRNMLTIPRHLRSCYRAS
jgi:hypothetical protein